MSAAMRRAIVTVKATIRLISIRSLHLQAMARIELLANPFELPVGLVIEARGEPESPGVNTTYPHPGTTRRPIYKNHRHLGRNARVASGPRA